MDLSTCSNVGETKLDSELEVVTRCYMPDHAITTPCAASKMHMTLFASKRQEQHPWSSCHHCGSSQSLLLCVQYHEDIPKLEVLATLKRKLCLCLA
jgi:hypothetical protein